MGTKLGGVEVPIRLDVSEINRQIADLETKLAADKAAGRLGAGPTSASPGAAPLKLEPQAQMSKQYSRQLVEATMDEVRQKVSGNVASSQTIGVLGRVAPFIPKGALPVVAAAGSAIAAYGIASEGVKILPEAWALGRRIAGETATGAQSPTGGIELVQNILDGFKARLVALESKVTALFTAGQKTVQFNQAVERLTGQLPNTRYYYQFFREYDEQQKQMNSRFDTWKSREAPFVTAQSFFDYFRRAIFR